MSEETKVSREAADAVYAILNEFLAEGGMNQGLENHEFNDHVFEFFSALVSSNTIIIDD